MLIAAAGAGLLVLLLHGRAEAASVGAVEPAERWLMDRTPLSSDERLEAADQVLRRSTTRWLRDLNAGALETGGRLLLGGSPYGVIKSGYGLARHLFGLRERGAAEDVALDLLEPALGLGTASDPLRARYQQLQLRERRWLAGRKLARAREALAAGEPRLARLRAERALDFWPEHGGAQRLLRKLDEASSAAPALEAGDPIIASPDEVAVATALLRGQDGEVRRLAPATRTGALTRGLVEYFEGDPERALETFSELARGDDAMAALARRWIEDPEIDPGSALRREQRSYRVRRALGWLGGSALASDGLELSTDAYRAWRQSLRPLNLAISLPSRVMSGFEPEPGQGLRAAASMYLQERPAGPLAPDAEGWLERLGPDADASTTLFNDGSLVLPAAVTPYATLLVEPVVITRRVLEHGLFERGQLLADAFGDARAILLLPRNGGDDAHALHGEDALAVIAELSRGIERGELAPQGRSGFATLEALRRLEGAVREGASLRARAFAPDGPVLGLRRTLLDGGSGRAAGGLEVVRDGEELQVAKRFVSERFPCPQRSVCIDRDSSVDAAVFGRLEADSDATVGLESRVFDTRLSFEVSTDRAEAEFVLPLTHWLGVDRWLPFDARVGVGTDGVSVFPRLRHQDEDEARSWELGIHKEF
jgi:hypothetical protein